MEGGAAITVQDVRSTQELDTGQAERAKLRRELSRLDTIFFLISAMVVVDTIGAIAVGGGQAFTWLVVLFVFFFIPSALASAELGAAVPDEGGAYVWVRMAFGRFAGALTSLLYWAGTPMWLGGSVAVVAMSVYGRFFGELPQPALYLFGAGFIGLATLGRWCRCATASGCRPAGPSGRSACSPSSPSAWPSTAPATGSTASPSAT
jgi:amino acid transporter